MDEPRDIVAINLRVDRSTLERVGRRARENRRSRTAEIQHILDEVTRPDADRRSP